MSAGVLVTIERQTCVCVCLCARPAEADPSLCVSDSSIMKVSAVQLAESDSFNGISSQGRPATASGSFNTTLTQADRGYGPKRGTWSPCSIREREAMLKEHSGILGNTFVCCPSQRHSV